MLGQYWLAHALQVAGDQDQAEGALDAGGVGLHQLHELVERGGLQLVLLVVARDDGARERDVAADEGVQAVFDHALGELGHARDVLQLPLQGRLLEKELGVLRYVHGLVADALEVGVDLDRGHDEAQVGGRRLVQGDQLEAAVVDLDVELVDLVLVLLEWGSSKFNIPSV